MKNPLLKKAKEFRDKCLEIFTRKASSKYNAGQKEHGGYLPMTGTLDDLEEEIIDAWFYLQAIKERQGHLKGATISRIHVNQHLIRSNYKNGRNDPVLTVKKAGENIKCNVVTGDGPFKVIYSPDKALECGAKVWIETKAKLTYANK